MSKRDKKNGISAVEAKAEAQFWTGSQEPGSSIVSCLSYARDWCCFARRVCSSLVVEKVASVNQTDLYGFESLWNCKRHFCTFVKCFWTRHVFRDSCCERREQTVRLSEMKAGVTFNNPSRVFSLRNEHSLKLRTKVERDRAASLQARALAKAPLVTLKFELHLIGCFCSSGPECGKCGPRRGYLPALELVFKPVFREIAPSALTPANYFANGLGLPASLLS